MENYGATGEILRYKKVLNRLDLELKQWRQVTELFKDQPFAGNIFVGEALRQQHQLQQQEASNDSSSDEDDRSDTENQPPSSLYNETQKKKKKKQQQKKKRVAHKAIKIKVTQRIYPESKNTKATTFTAATPGQTNTQNNKGNGKQDQTAKQRKTDTQEEKAAKKCFCTIS